MKPVLYLNVIIFFTIIQIGIGQNIAISSFTKDASDMTARVTDPVKDQNGEKCALIKIRTTQQGFVFDGDMLGIAKIIQKTGEVWVYVPAKARQLTIKHQQLGVQTYTYGVPIEEATVYIMQLSTGNVVTTVVPVTTPMQWVTISTTPAGADVYINETYMGVTPFQKKMEVGSLDYRISLNMYHIVAGKIALKADQRSALEFDLKPNYGKLVVHSQPEEGASISINGQSMEGVTPFTTSNLKSGKYQVTVKKVMFQPKTMEVEVLDGVTLPVEINMDPNFATIQLESDEASEIFIDDEKVGVRTYNGRVMPGIHSIKAVKEKHKDAVLQIEGNVGGTLTYNLKPTPITGSADIISTPFGARILLNGQEMGTTPTTIHELLIGEYSLRLTKEGCAEVNRSVTIKENQIAEIKEDLVTGKDVIINSVPKNAEVYIDDQLMGNSPLPVTLAFGKHELKIIKGEDVSSQPIEITELSPLHCTIEIKAETLLDIDGNEYKTIQIGEQRWMAENLKVTHFANGTPIPHITDNDAWAKLEDNDTDKAYCFYNNNESLGYGALYTYAAATNGVESANKVQGVCPAGWHLPSFEEWMELENYLADNEYNYDGTLGGGRAKIAMSMSSTIGWDNSKILGHLGNKLGNNNSSGFTAIPGGHRHYKSGKFDNMGGSGYWWSSIQGNNSSLAYFRYLYYDTAHLIRNSCFKSTGLSVRCVKD